MALDNYFTLPHGGRPPIDEVVRAATLRYCVAERNGMMARPLDAAEMKRLQDFNERIANLYPPSRTPAATESGRERGKTARRLVK